ncbi:hypothetical protein ACWFPY_08330 [Nocardia fluminea]
MGPDDPQIMRGRIDRQAGGMAVDRNRCHDGTSDGVDSGHGPGETIGDVDDAAGWIDDDCGGVSVEFDCRGNGMAIRADHQQLAGGVPAHQIDEVGDRVYRDRLGRLRKHLTHWNRGSDSLGAGVDDRDRLLIGVVREVGDIGLVCSGIDSDAAGVLADGHGRFDAVWAGADAGATHGGRVGGGGRGRGRCR